jgi:hypothetical protein
MSGMTEKRAMLASVEETAERVGSWVDDTVRAARHLPAVDLPWVLGGLEALAKAAFDLYDDVTDCLDDRGYEDPDGEPADVSGGMDRQDEDGDEDPDGEGDVSAADFVGG